MTLTHRILIDQRNSRPKHLSENGKIHLNFSYVFHAHLLHFNDASGDEATLIQATYLSRLNETNYAIQPF